MRGSTKRVVIAALVCALLGAAPVHAAGLAPGEYRFELPMPGRLRSYLVHVPPQAAAASLPVVINLHGGGGNAEQHRRATRMDAAADRDGYLAVYPNGTGRGSRLLTWNAGFCCGHALKEGVDDVAFVARLIDDLIRRGGVDPARVYVVGHSNGGMMAHRLGEALPDRIAAIVSVSGAYVPAPDPAARAMPVLHVHSLDDPRAPYAGGLGPPFPLTRSRVLHPAVETALAAWVSRDGCAPRALQIDSRQAGAQSALHFVHAGCREGAAVELWQVRGGGHGWPGGEAKRTRLVGPATTVIDANAEIWAFVSRFALRVPGTAH